MPTYPEQLYQSLDAALIDRFIAEQQEEHLHLDFKAARDTSLKDNKSNLAIALSGFANADGGVIVWGVDARRNSQGIDCACGKLPINSLADLLSHLNEFTGQAANPIVGGVLHRGIRAGQDEGFAVTLVPASDGGPHMAKFGEDRYYKRVGSRFAKMEHYEVADMFGRRARPVLEVDYKITSHHIGAAQRAFHVMLRLKNTGRGSARAPFIHISSEPGTVHGLANMASAHKEAPMRLITPSEHEARLIGMGDFIIHPGIEYEVARVVLGVPTGADPGGLRIKYTLAADNCGVSKGEINLSAEQLTATPLK